jgi:ABC-2 type transport system ATP-binding protein
MHRSSVVVVVKNLGKVYTRARRRSGFLGSLSAFVQREIENVHALKGISFTLEEGEILGFVGPNGAGKTTTLKILAGVLYPTCGYIRVLGNIPQWREKGFLRQISFLMGSRGFLEEATWDLSVLDGLRFIKELYNVSESDFRSTLDELIELLQIRELLAVPLRQLSHGQRIRAELVASLLWHPKLLLLDEPTLGLDVVSQKALWDFIKAYVAKHGTSTILTSHYMRDVEELAGRLILIDNGIIVYDGSPSDIVKKFSVYKLVKVEFERAVPNVELECFGEVVKNSTLETVLRVPQEGVKGLIKGLLERFPVRDFSIEEPDLEKTLREYFSR